MRAKYSAGLEPGDCPVIWVEDEFEQGCMSVTNDAERVVAEVVKLYGDHPIVYEDTMGRWDQLRHKAGVFERFGKIAVWDRHQAVWAVRQLARAGKA